ncbi:MAG TPA: YfiR family protein [Bryobacteraceae bacterium]|nr:YfiR family protein [Bryobacteraceae bacterium]
MALLSPIEMTRLLSLMVLLAAALQVHAEVPGFDEYQVKAAFLYNFAKFVEWPPGTFAKPNDPIEICIVGQNPFGSTLEDMVQGKKMEGRAFAVRQLPDTQQAGKCQILFIGASEGKRTRALLEALKGAAILTVGETGDFTSLGGIVSFRLEGPRVHIQIALDTAEHARLRVSSKLLSLAEIAKKQP